MSRFEAFEFYEKRFVHIIGQYYVNRFGIIALFWTGRCPRVSGPGRRCSLFIPPSDNSWDFLDLPLGKYRFHTSVQLEQTNQSKVSPPETNGVLDQKALSLHFSIEW